MSRTNRELFGITSAKKWLQPFDDHVFMVYIKIHNYWLPRGRQHISTKMAKIFEKN